MSATSPLGAVGALGLALLTIALLQRRFGVPAQARAFATIDGLRGYAAFSVFLHHSAIWHGFARTGLWIVPPTRLYTHFGQSSVALFFMITGFLFWSKLIDGRSRPIDWRRLFISRVLRLTPLFVFLIAMLWLFALALSGFHLRESIARAGLETLQWLAFTIPGMPNFNRAPTTIMGGQAWSLPYEWWFYLSLPLAAALLSLRPARRWLTLGVAGTAAGVWWVSAYGSWPVAAMFLGGIAAAALARQPRLRAWAVSPSATVVCVAALAAVTRFDTVYAVAPLLVLSIAFAIIACGNSVFGTLEWPAARGLGEVGYSLYLLHGLVLFALFGWALGAARTATLTPAEHWIGVGACSIVVTLVSFVTFRVIEAPAMRAVDRVSALAAP